MADMNEEYERALGRFVSASALVETSIRVQFLFQTGIGGARVAALFDNTTPPISRTIGMLKRLAVLDKMPPEDFKGLTETFEQFGYISSLRDRLVHSGGFPVEGAKFFLNPVWKDSKPNRLAALVEGNVYALHELSDATDDISTIQHRIYYHFSWQERNDDEHWKHSKNVSHVPWRYKHRAPSPANQIPKGKKGRLR